MQEKFELRFAHVTSTSTPKGLAADFFAKQIEEKSDGRIQVEVFPNSELYGDKDEMQALQSNAVQMLAPASAKFTTITPSLQVLDFRVHCYDHPDEIPEIVSPDTESPTPSTRTPTSRPNGLKVLGLWDSGMKRIHSNNATLYPDDMKGKKYRIQPSDVLRTQFETWGGIPSPLAFAEVYNGLRQGLIDGGETHTRTSSRRRCTQSRSTSPNSITVTSATSSP